MELALRAQANQAHASHALAARTHLVLSGLHLLGKLALQALQRKVDQAVVQELGHLEPGASQSASMERIVMTCARSAHRSRSAFVTVTASASDGGYNSGA